MSAAAAATEGRKEAVPEFPDAAPIAPLRARAHEELPSRGSGKGAAIRGAAAKAAVLVNTGTATSLLRRQPSSLAQARDRHHIAAGHFEAGALRWPRLAWGYFHLLVKAVLHLAEWVTESPPRLAVALVLIVVIHFWG
jgi:hypothetical protein